MLVENLTKDTAEHSTDSAIINEEHDEEHISTMNNTLINDQNDSQTVKNEIDKLWKATEAINQKFEFPKNLSQVDALQHEIDKCKLKALSTNTKKRFKNFNKKK